MKNINLKTLSLVVSCLLPFSSAAEITNFTPIGYVKWGNIYSNNKDRNEGKGKLDEVIRADGGLGNYRLGNEMNWWEGGFRTDLWQKDETVFDFTWYIGSGENWGDVGTLQTWASAYHLFPTQPNAKVWLGKRFYRRHEVHMIDVKFWDVSDNGIGVENIDVGFANAHLAWMTPESSADGRALHNLDLRLSDIRLSKEASLILGANYLFSQNARYAEKNVTTRGAMLSALWHQNSSLGSNTLALQYGRDALAGGLISAEGASEVKYSTGIDHDGYSWRVFNFGELNVNDDMAAMYSVAYQDLHLDNQRGMKWFSAGIRPQYSWNHLMATALELGYESVDAQNNAGTNRLYKVTLAQILQAGKGLWARPALRLFVTWSEKDTQWERLTANGSYYKYAAPVKTDAGRVEEVTFGFNFEAWW